jgi:hypothetical protein
MRLVKDVLVDDQEGVVQIGDLVSPFMGLGKSPAPVTGRAGVSTRT